MSRPKQAQNSIPQQKPNQVVQAGAAAVQFHGPLPLPQLLEGYEKVVPGSAERIIRMAEEQQAHRHSLEQQALRSESRNSLFGIVCAFLIGMTTVVCGSVVPIQEYNGRDTQ
jgi:uncharacterized membrane protein